MVRKILSKNSPGDSTHFASDDWDQMNGYLSNVDQSATDPAEIATHTTYRDNRLRLWNLAMDHSIRVRTNNFGEDYDLTVPDITGDDELLLLLHPQQFQNKIINLTLGNVLKTTDIQLGDTLKADGIGYKRVPLGTADQVWKVNTTGTDAEWGTAAIGGGGGGGTPDDDSVSTIKIQNLAVTTAKINDAAVTNIKLAGSISGDKILSDAITTAKIANSQITDAKLAGSISGSKLASGGVGTTQLTDGAVTNAKLAGSITQDKLNQITDTNKLPNSIVYNWNAFKYGVYTLSTATGGDGIWNGFLTSTGTHTNFSTTSTNFRARYSTGTTIGNQAGLRTTSDYTKSQYAYPDALHGKISLDNNSQTNFYFFIGLHEDSSFPTGDVVDWGDNKSFIGLWINHPSDSFRTQRNNGGLSSSGSNLSPLTGHLGTGNHEFNIYYDTGAANWKIIFDGTTNTYTDGPALNTSMGLIAYIETKDTTAKELEIAWLYCQTQPR